MPVQGDDHVARRHVTVGQALLGQVGQGRADGVQERGALLVAQAPPRPEHHGQIRPRHELDADHRPLPGQGDDLVDRGDPRVPQAAQGAEPLQDPVASRAPGQVEEVDGHGPVLAVQAPDGRGPPRTPAAQGLSQGEPGGGEDPQGVGVQAQGRVRGGTTASGT